ncbi:MAG: succinylglutamate desuccinylase/aspartoacylase family protein [Desulfofustis sp.]|nr:succinylglutamate desuccinylase/aspartoacylase family protein [Desulfofustis sp.]
MRTTETRVLPQASPGTRRSLKILRYGEAGDRPKAYLQAGLHADEAPGYAVLHALIQKLDTAATQGSINGEIIVVPAANPIGLDQWRDDMLHGRFDFVNSINFNRQHHDLIDRLIEAVGPKLGDDAEKNVAAIRTCTADLLAALKPDNEAATLKQLLLSLSHDADIVLDLHCDLEALMHVYIGTPLWPKAEDLSAQMGAEATLLAADSGGTPFDEANSRPWWVLAEQFPDHQIPPACLAATVELRGFSDTDPEMIERDSDNLFDFLQRRGFIDGEPDKLPTLINGATPLTGVDYVKASSAGIIVYLKKLGDTVAKDESIAQIINPLPEHGDQQLVEVKSGTDGLLFSRNADRFARPGKIIAKIAGSKPLTETEGHLLTL